MRLDLTQSYDRLIAAVVAMPEVLSIGKSGGAGLPKAGQGDVDIFIFCDAVPAAEKRRAAAETPGACITAMQVGIFSGKHWGTCDYVFLGHMEVCLMYFTIAGMNNEIEMTLSGARPDKEDNYFYPTGRCASFLTMHPLCDKRGYIASVQERLRVYPEKLAAHLIRCHLDLLDDAEDLERAVSRKDALFYHFALDLSLDHFLQALFALNRRFFPSRKRSVSFIDTFAKKPEHCAQRILDVVALGARGETVSQSYEAFTSLFRDLRALC